MARAAGTILSGFILSVLLIAGLAPIDSARAEDSTSAIAPAPVFAYYYIWFDPTSWNRAKTDYPALGRYSSSDPDVMRQHIQWAQDAGIDGFIVSWKSTPTLNHRLEQLMSIAAEEQFKLAIIYQGLDFHRDPLPVDRIAADLDFFAFEWGTHEAFNTFEKPLVIWSGTWEFTEVEIADVTRSIRDRLLVLSSERNLDGYLRLADLVDGNAYYWSSVNPETFPGYQEKLIGMGQAVHDNHGVWIAPAAPGFDARLIGGTTVVDRLDGETLRRQIATATKSSPDVLGIISWNEFSENTHIEPSLEHGSRYLEVLAQLDGVEFEMIGEFDSSSPAATGASNGVPILAFTTALMAVSLAVVIWRATNRIEHQRGENEMYREESLDDAF